MNLENMAYDKECYWGTVFFVSHDLLTAITIFTMLIGVLAAFGNSLVLLSIYKKNSLRSTQMVFIGSLAVADLSVGIITMPFYVSAALSWPLLLKNGLFEMVLDFLVFQTLSASSFSLSVVSYDRFLAITSPMTYVSLVNKRKVYARLLLIWVLSVIIGSCSFVVEGYEIRPSIYLIVVIVSFGVPFTFIAFFYFKIYQVARQHARQITDQENTSRTIENSSIEADGSVDERRTRKRDHKAAMTIAMIIGTFAVCWLPNLTIGVLHFVTSNYSECLAEKTEQFWLITIPFAIANSAVNPVIYAVRNGDFREAFRQILRL